jgi:protein involved in polysaccharide export with SLBB domain
MTITGQVTLPGRYYISRAAPPTLVDALAHARGVREAEDPRYVSVYRRDTDGSMISARFRLNANKGTTRVSLFHDNALGEGAFAQVKPGDVIVVERTFRSRVRQVLAGALRVSVGVSASTSATYHEDFQDTGAARAAGGGPEIITQNLLP